MRNQQQGSRMSEIFGAPIVRGWDRPKPEFGEPEEAAVLEVLRSGTWCSLGSKQVEHVERELERRWGVKHAILGSSGTAGITAVAYAECMPGGEAIIPAGTFGPGTASGLLAAGVIPRVVDVTGNWTMDPVATEAAVGPNTVAIFPVAALYDRQADMPALEAVGQRAGVRVYNDAAHTFGATLGGHLMVTMGRAAVVSFQDHKNVRAGELGVVVTDDTELAECVRTAINCGRPNGWGVNLRPNPFAAALLLPQLARAPEQHDTRAAVFPRIRAVLRSFGLETAPEAEGGDRLPMYQVTSLMPEEALQGVHPSIAREALSYLLRIDAMPPYWGLWNDPKWSGVLDQFRRLVERDAVFRKGLQDTFRPQPAWGCISARGINFEHFLGLNEAAPERIHDGLELICERANALNGLAPLPRALG